MDGDVVGEPLVEGADSNEPLGADEFQEALKDGIYLCKLATAIIGPTKYNNMKVAFKQMENISNFPGSCEKYGMVKTDLFQTVDLFEKQNMWAVVNTLHALGRKAQVKGFAGPVLGPKESQKNVREFDEEVLKAGQGVIGLQMGTNKMASQKGMSFGGQRHIADLKVDEASKEGQGVIGLQMGTTNVASQKGMSFGGSRGIADKDYGSGTKEGQGIIGLQMGTNQGASASGMNMGKTRSIVD